MYDHPIEPLVRRLESAGVSIQIVDREGRKIPRFMLEDECRKRHLLHADTSHPLDLLFAQGKLRATPDEEMSYSHDRLEIGAYLALLHWRQYGRPVQASANGYTAPLNEEEIQELLERAKRMDIVDDLMPLEREWLASARYNALRATLKRKGRYVEAVVLATCAHLVHPRAAQLSGLRHGLSAMLDIDLPSREDIPAHLSQESA